MVNRGLHSRGFTLVELLVTIGVIGVLVSGMVILIDPATQLRRGRDAARKSDLSLIRSAFELYRSDVGNYPSQASITTSGVLNCNVPFTGGSPPNTYLTRVPCDPLDPASTYFYSGTGSPVSTYELWGCLENVEDKDRDDVDGGTNDSCGTVGTPNERVSYTLRNP